MAVKTECVFVWPVRIMDAVPNLFGAIYVCNLRYRAFCVSYVFSLGCYGFSIVSINAND